MQHHYHLATITTTCNQFYVLMQMDSQLGYLENRHYSHSDLKLRAADRIVQDGYGQVDLDEMFIKPVIQQSTRELIGYRTPDEVMHDELPQAREYVEQRLSLAYEKGRSAGLRDNDSLDGYITVDPWCEKLEFRAFGVRNKEIDQLRNQIRATVDKLNRDEYRKYAVDYSIIIHNDPQAPYVVRGQAYTDITKAREEVRCFSESVVQTSVSAAS